ncbi:uncharacterized protein CYBJADRAFT_169798 [Cyberlindnera jadinii NRRL Y-1542]|uniref:Uncharacterized protein n=1 Tax=Cyberlindnera jadinii (strain ATCC 18201 / CBS 1600 / BCRC 20928 / JCM 3617 / NBRC 0987 / NRRL Y-1542) TaxID=983966 RepID=A0A1E4RUQ6_CYBJN|nr:hypothetical protein CYBJADRAFT_169798 [Cyberlindnera jadinii NRRL Y-1542]ODV70941.1 hypothetical protein CYBJADRAFT_169798 [Cyberlindnera jadinii NRRL Y-1542]
MLNECLCADLKATPEKNNKLCWMLSHSHEANEVIRAFKEEHDVPRVQRCCKKDGTLCSFT